jgi:hypothetical protein
MTFRINRLAWIILSVGINLLDSIHLISATVLYNRQDQLKEFVDYDKQRDPTERVANPRALRLRLPGLCYHSISAYGTIHHIFTICQYSLVSDEAAT